MIRAPIDPAVLIWPVAALGTGAANRRRRRSVKDVNLLPYIGVTRART